MSTSMEKVHLLFTRPNFPEHAKSTLSSMLEDSKKGLFYDVNLISGLDGKKIAAHRSVLSTVNDYFRTMFTSTFKEAEDKNVTLSDISGDILEPLISYCYTGTIEINEDNVQLLLPQAQLMLFTEVVEACSHFLQSLVNPTNCISLSRYAKLYNCDRLLRNAKEYMQEHFLNVVVTQEFLTLNEEEIEEYVSNDKLTVNNEKDVFEAVMRWVNHDQDTRTPSLSKLLSVVRLQQLDTSYILEYIANNCDNQNTLSAFAKGVKQNLSNAQDLPERTGSKTRLIIVYHDKIAIYNPITTVIESEHTFDVNSCTPTLLDEKVILVGETDVKSFDLTTETWIDLAPTQTKRIEHAVAVLDGHIYVVGGKNENTVEKWDAELNKWSYVANMHLKREGACTAVLNGMLYVMGGKSSDDEHFSSVECYNPITNKWSFCKSMLEEKSYAKAIVLNEEIYVFGGITSNSTSSIEKYNPVTDTWTKMLEMEESRWALGACRFGKEIILFGGENDNVYIRSMDVYDPLTNEIKLITTELPKHQYKVDIFSYEFIKTDAVLIKFMKFFKHKMLLA